MMPIDTTTLGSATPKALDGRSYPTYLKAFELYDREMLSEVRRLEAPTLNMLAVEAPTPELRSIVSPWLSSAEWRGLIGRVKVDEMAGKRRYRLTQLGEEHLGRFDAP